MSRADATSQPEHTNRLIGATSPYLLQHAHNPVDWHEWGPEPLERAKLLNMPIFLSIGYSACHWCHVMERECFENEDIAAVMNAHFVNIKVDREERPDLDEIYMSATQAMTQSGGWPMSVWLTPDLQPFYTGTYFPPESRYGRPGFPDVLKFLADAWKNQHDKVMEQATALTAAVRQITSAGGGERAAPPEAVARAAEVIARQFDATRGGVISGGTNKFPPSMAMGLMLRAYDQSIESGAPNRLLLDRVETTLESMAYGGIYDHLAGGIARYSTDADWLVPHFEKMLYDQALVCDIYVDAWRLTKKPLYEETARHICDYVLNDLRDSQGGFYSARDADSEGVEGKYYVWDKDEIRSILGDDVSAMFCDFHDVSAHGNWEGRNILNVPNEPEHVAEKYGLDIAEFRQRINDARAKLLAARGQRVAPLRDDKVLSGWNGLMIASLAKAGRVFCEPRFTDAATAAADFVLNVMTDDAGRLLRTWRDGRAHTAGYLDDYACVIEALLNLYETTFDMKWLEAAERLNADVMKHFHDPADGAFYFTADDAETVLVRIKSAVDSAVPSGTSVQLMNLLRLSVLLDRGDYADASERVLAFYGDKALRMPFSSERLLAAADYFHRRPKEVAVVCTTDARAKADAMIDAAWRIYVPNMAMALLVADGTDAERAASRLALLTDKAPVAGEAVAYVCRDYACLSPVRDVDKMLAKLRTAPGENAAQ